MPKLTDMLQEAIVLVWYMRSTRKHGGRAAAGWLLGTVTTNGGSQHNSVEEKNNFATSSWRVKTVL